jgi:ferric-dicitrate binding protein FerR (iron transport regulator)
MDNQQRQLLQKFLNGLCSKSEEQQVKQLLETAEGKTILSELMEERDQAAGLYEKPGANEQDLDGRVQYWKTQVYERMTPLKKNAITPVRRLRFLRHVAVWAGIVLTVGVAVWQVKKATTPQEIVYIKKENAKGVPVHYILPDSSSIYLAAGSSFSYAEDYPKSGRDINLDGAAFFDVKRDEAHPVTIHTGEVQTRVLGTSFRVTAFAGEPMEVAVATGKVAVSAAEGKTELAMLTPGEKVSYDPATKKAEPGNIEIDALQQWKTGELVFDEEPLELVAKELKRHYGVTVVCRDGATAGYRVSGTFEATDSVETVLKMLSILGKFKYEVQDGNTYYLSKTKDMRQQ